MNSTHQVNVESSSTPWPSNLTYNDSYKYQEVEQYQSLFCYLHICVLPISVAGFAFNILNIVVIVRACRSDLSFFFKVLISLAASDGLMDVVLMLTATVRVDHCTSSKPLTSFANKFCLPHAAIFTFTLAVSAALLNLTLIALDHFLLIVKPLKHSIWLSNNSKITNLLALGVWAASGMLAVSPWILQAYLNTDFGMCSAELALNALGVALFCLAVLTADCATAMVVCYALINIHMRHMDSDVRRSGAPRNHRKLLITSLLLVGTFLLCFLPQLLVFFLLLLYFLLNVQNAGIYKALGDAYIVSFVLVLTNTLCDPLIYVVRIEKVRNKYRQLWAKFTG